MVSGLSDKNVFLMDSEQRCAEGVIYSLSRNRFSVIAMSPVRLFPSRFSKHIFSWKHSPRLDDGFNKYFEFLCSLKQRGPVIPSGDLSVKFLSTYKEVLQSEGFLVNVPDPNTLFRLFDKWQCNQLCERIGVPVAKSALVNDYADAEKALEAMNWPVIVKPTSLAGGGYIRVHSKKELKNAIYSLSSKVSKSNFKIHESGILVQEWIDLKMTDNWSCDVFFDKHGKLVDSVTIKRIRTSLNKEGLPTSRMYCGEIRENKSLAERTQFLLEQQGWKGFAHVEFIFCRKINDYVLTEVNPRLPGYSYLLSSSGHEQAYYYCADLIGTKYQTTSTNDVLYYFETLRYPGDITDGLINSWKGYLSFRELLKSYYIAYKSNSRTVIDYFNIKDLRMTVALQCFNFFWFTEKLLCYIWRRIRPNAKSQ